MILFMKQFGFHNLPSSLFWFHLFRCGYHQKHPDPENRPYVDGILGLGSGKEGILSQLRELGLIKNVVGHCLSTQGGGYLFLGDEFVPSSTVWTPMVTTNEFA